MEPERFSKMREFSRIDANIPFQVRLVPPEERANIRCNILGETMLAEFQALPEHEDKLLSDWLKMLNAKLDSIINMLTFHGEGFNSMPFSKVNISGGGLSFSVAECYQEGDVLEMKILLPIVPPIAMYIYGEVVKIDKHLNGYTIGTKFVAMDEEIRDEIVKFVFRKQREILRGKRL